VDLSIVAITDRQLGDPLRVVPALLAGGVTAIMLREKDLSRTALLEMADPLRAICRRYGATFIVNGSIDVAHTVEADALHLGHDALPLTEARNRVGRKLFIGVSVHNDAERVAAERDGADYVILSPMYPPNSKPRTTTPLGLEGLRHHVDLARLPIVALGGIDATRVVDCFEAGASGVAAIGALFGAPDPEAAARRFCASKRS